MVEEAGGEGAASFLLGFARRFGKAKTPMIAVVAGPLSLASLMSLIVRASVPRSGNLGKQLFLLEEYLVRGQVSGLRFRLEELNDAEALVHGHRHPKWSGTTKSMRKTVGSVPCLTYELIDLSCCGMAGSFNIGSRRRRGF